MAAKGSKPFVRRGITFASQYAYRQYLAAEKGFASPAARNKAVKATRDLVRQFPGGLTAEQQGVVAAGLADYRHRIGSFVEGTALAKRTSNRLPRELVILLRSMGGDQYPLWRALYK
jgi:hypothetical protein